MTTERWARLSDWHNAWLAADAVERQRLRTWLAAEHPDLVPEADDLASASAELGGFLETPAFVLAAPELAKEAVLAAETMVGPYRIVAFLARGGTGEVYRATDVRLRRDVALKVLTPEARGDGDSQRVERFVREARLTASLDHPNIVRLYDVGLFDGRPYFVAELLDGETLRARIGRGTLTIEEVLRIGTDVARGLVAAHAAGSVHRDLKPENIFLTRQGATKILDFGIAKLAIDDAARDGLSTLTGVVLGTAGYLAPEQIRGAEVDGRADLFALGAILFEMLTGRRAFAREHTVDTLHAILHDAPPDALEERRDVPPALAAVVRRLLEKAPDARFQSAGDLVSALEEIEIGPRVDLGRDSTPTRSPQVIITRARTRLGVAAALTLATLVAVTGWLYTRAAAPAPPGRATTVAVLPFRSLPDSADSQLLELGLADVVISRLNQLSDVRVLPLSATERLRSADPREAGRTLGADSGADRHPPAGAGPRSRERSAPVDLGRARDLGRHFRRRCHEYLLYPGRGRGPGAAGNRAAPLVQRAQPARRTWHTQRRSVRELPSWPRPDRSGHGRRPGPRRRVVPPCRDTRSGLRRRVGCSRGRVPPPPFDRRS